MNKYYFIVLRIETRSLKTFFEDVCTIHPFEESKRWRDVNKNDGDNVTLINWKEITKIEYDLFKNIELKEVKSLSHQ